MCLQCTLPNGILQCGSSTNLSVLTCNCATLNEENGHAEAGYCQYTMQEISIVQLLWATGSLLRNLSHLNEFMCGDLLNRSGTLCGAWLLSSCAFLRFKLCFLPKWKANCCFPSSLFCSVDVQTKNYLLQICMVQSIGSYI